MRPFVLAIVLAGSALAGVAQAQTYDPIQAQQRLNQMQLDVQSQQLHQLQRRNDAALQQGDPGQRADAAAERLQLHRQADDLSAARQQMVSPGANPSDIGNQLQISGDRLRRLQIQSTERP
jgi:TolA-binding protein